MSEFKASLARRVRAHRGRLSLRQAEQQCGVPFGTLRRIENGSGCSLENFARLVRWANIDANKLLGLAVLD